MTQNPATRQQAQEALAKARIVEAKSSRPDLYRGSPARDIMDSRACPRSLGMDRNEGDEIEDTNPWCGTSIRPCGGKTPRCLAVPVAVLRNAAAAWATVHLPGRLLGAGGRSDVFHFWHDGPQRHASFKAEFRYGPDDEALPSQAQQSIHARRLAWVRDSGGQ